ETLGEQIEDLVLALSQRIKLLVRPRRNPVRRRPTHETSDARDQLGRIDRLDQIVVCPKQKPRGPIERVGSLAGDENDRYGVAVALAQLPADLIAVQAG